MTNIPTNSDIFKCMEKLAPKSKAYDWDNVGLQIGSYNHKAEKIMVTLDVLESVVDEAIEENVKLIIAHHPLLFTPLKQIDIETTEGRIISKLIRHGITVYAAHTNLDVVKSGVNDMLVDKLGLLHTEPLITLGTEALYKYAVHVPISHQEIVKQALGDAGAGKQGDYSHCSFQIEGEGAFKPLAGADPYIGKVGELTKVEEVKIEAIVPKSRLDEVVQAVKKAHPYEEAAYDIIKLQHDGDAWGLGRIGEITASLQLGEYISQVKERLNVKNVRVTGDLNKKIKKVAILGGSGEKYINHAKSKGADVYITGDMSFHLAQSAWQMGLAVIDAGHHIEEVMKEGIQAYLRKELASFNIDIIISKQQTDPFQYL